MMQRLNMPAAGFPLLFAVLAERDDLRLSLLALLKGRSHSDITQSPGSDTRSFGTFAGGSPASQEGPAAIQNISGFPKDLPSRSAAR
jgi:hypothetical protein